MSPLDRPPSRLDAISTRWTELRCAHEGSMCSSTEARASLAMRYLPAIRRYVQAMVQNPQDAEDLTQDILVRLIAGDFAVADPGRGRFRDLLKVSVRNMVRHFWQKQTRRRTVNLDVEILEKPDSDEPDDPWLVSWRNTILDLAWNALQQEDRQRAGSFDHSLLKLRAAYPDDTSEQLSARLSKQLGKPVRADAVRQRLHRVRKRFADLLITELAKSLDNPTPQRIEDELLVLGLLAPVRILVPDEWA